MKWCASFLALAALASLGGCNEPTATELEPSADVAFEDSPDGNLDARQDESVEATSESENEAAPKTAKVRKFQFDYAFELSGVDPGAEVKIWMPVPTSSEYQTIEQLPYDLPAEPKQTTEAKYGNDMLYLETQASEEGTLSFKVPYKIERKEVLGLSPYSDVAATESEEALFLAPNSNVPIDGKPLELLADMDLEEEGLACARQLYDIVDDHVSYNKEGTGWGNGDVLWVCDSKYGNCTDFHSLFISLARSKGLPARFEIGFPIAPDKQEGTVGGYHCWAYVFVKGTGWIPVDISEADKHPEKKEYYFGHLTADRVSFSTGRDIELEPKSESGPLNYFIYPHVEVDGAQLPREQIALKFAYKDQE